MPSSVIAKIVYEADHARLTVTLTNGRIYQYFMVPADVAGAFQSANSKGTFFNSLIRDRYAYRQVASIVASKVASKVMVDAKR